MRASWSLLMLSSLPRMLNSLLLCLSIRMPCGATQVVHCISPGAPFTQTPVWLVFLPIMLHSGMLSWPLQSSGFSPFTGHSKMLREVPQTGASGPDVMRGPCAPPPPNKISHQGTLKTWGGSQEWTKKGALTPQVKPSHLSDVKLPTENHSKDSWAKIASAIATGKPKWVFRCNWLLHLKGDQLMVQPEVKVSISEYCCQNSLPRSQDRASHMHFF